MRALGSVDILVNSAGIAPMADFFELSQAEYDTVMAINLRAPFLLTQAVARRMRDQGTPGSVINLSSINAVAGRTDHRSAYCVSKGGLNQLTRNCAIALAPFGAVRVNAVGLVAPSPTGVGGRALGLTGAGSARPVLERTPMGRLGEASRDRPRSSTFLASDDASFVNGQTVYADGGRLGLNYSLDVAARRLA